MKDARNIRDEYKGWELDLIKKDLLSKHHPFAVCMQHITGDFNIGCLVRSCNALGAEKMFYFGRKRWDRRGATGTHNYTDMQYLNSIDELKELKKDYTFVGIEYLPEKACSINDFVWPQHSLLIVGEESSGLVDDVIELCDYLVYIPMYGSVRSFNVAVAGSIAMHDFVNKYNNG